MYTLTIMFDHTHNQGGKTKTNKNLIHWLMNGNSRLSWSVVFMRLSINEHQIKKEIEIQEESRGFFILFFLNPLPFFAGHK